MPRGRVLNQNHLRLQTYYNVSTAEPKKLKPLFGNQVRLPLSVGAKYEKFDVAHDEANTLQVKRNNPEAGLLPPTLTNLAWDFGYMSWMVTNMLTISRTAKELAKKARAKGGEGSIILDPRFMENSELKETDNFEHEIVIPVREELLKQDLLFYCVPEFFEQMDSITAEFEAPASHQRVLCVLPKYVETAEYYGLTYEEIRILAPQVLWVVKLLCGHGVIKTGDQLRKSLDRWPTLANPYYVEKTRSGIFVKNPHLMTRETQLLLPCAEDK